jgi:hypothetical protein
MSDKILDIRPRIRRKQQADCRHLHVTVSMNTAVLTCDDCDSDLDPWLMLREICKSDEDILAWRLEQERKLDEKIEDGNKAIARMNDTIMQLNAEISRLNDVKNKLYNERVGDRLLGHAAARPRQPRKR